MNSLMKKILYFTILIISHLLGDSLIGLNHNQTFEDARIGDIFFSRHYFIHR